MKTTLQRKRKYDSFNVLQYKWNRNQQYKNGSVKAPRDGTKEGPLNSHKIEGDEGLGAQAVFTEPDVLHLLLRNMPDFGINQNVAIQNLHF